MHHAQYTYSPLTLKVQIYVLKVHVGIVFVVLVCIILLELAFPLGANAGKSRMVAHLQVHLEGHAPLSDVMLFAARCFLSHGLKYQKSR
jgi:hypothetical protein